MPHLLQSACLAGLVISAVPVAAISAPDGFARPGKYQYGPCANTVVPDYLRADYNTSSAGDLPLNIKLWMHVVAENKDSAPSQQALDDQVAVLNSAFNPHRINFTFSGQSETFNSSVLSLRYQDFVTTFVPQKRNGDYIDLNLFVHSSLWYNGIQDTDGTRHPALLGVSTWPVPTGQDLDPYGDSCVIDANTLPSKTSFESHASGMTAVHQVGHWLGLLHPFQGDNLNLDAHEEKDGCAEPNDFVSDTVPQGSQTSGCPAWKSSCGNVTVLDNIHNYMDLSDDGCMTEFTPGQAKRMHAVYNILRVGHKREAAAMPKPSSSPSPSPSPSPSLPAASLISVFPSPSADSQISLGLPAAPSASTSAQAALFMVTVIVASLSYFA